MGSKTSKIIGGVAILLGIIILIFLIGGGTADSEAVKNTVYDFGKKLQTVSLTASTSTIATAIEENYKPFISAELLSSWKANPAKAPGRLTSSPWPDRIEIDTVKMRNGGSYTVTARVIEITSEEVAHGGVAASYPVNITIEKIDNSWLITEFEKGPYTE